MEYAVRIIYKDGRTEERSCRSMIYAKREADLARSDRKAQPEKIEILRTAENGAEEILETFRI